MYVMDLKPGDKFTTPDNGGTVYTCESVRAQDGYAYVTYVSPSGIRAGYGTSPLSTVYPVDIPS